MTLGRTEEGEVKAQFEMIHSYLQITVRSLVKAKHFILGCEKLVCAKDDKLLMGLLNEKRLIYIDNPRLLMLKEKTLRFNFQVIWVP